MFISSTSFIGSWDWTYLFANIFPHYVHPPQPGLKPSWLVSFMELNIDVIPKSMGFCKTDSLGFASTTNHQVLESQINSLLLVGTFFSVCFTYYRFSLTFPPATSGRSYSHLSFNTCNNSTNCSKSYPSSPSTKPSLPHPVQSSRCSTVNSHSPSTPHSSYKPNDRIPCKGTFRTCESSKMSTQLAFVFKSFFL